MKRVIGLVVAIVAMLGLVAPPATSLPAWKTTASTRTNPAATHPRVVDLRDAQHPGFDRVVIDVRGRIPGYRAPKLVRPGFPALKAIAMTGDFVGRVTFAFGLQPRRTPCRIFRLHDPQRLVIDFRHS